MIYFTVMGNEYFRERLMSTLVLIQACMAPQNNAAYKRGGTHDCSEVKDSECMTVAVKCHNPFIIFILQTTWKTYFVKINHAMLNIDLS